MLCKALLVDRKDASAPAGSESEVLGKEREKVIMC